MLYMILLDLEELVIPNAINDVFLTQGRYPENFVLISQSEVCQEGEGQEGGTWRMLIVHDWRHG